MVLCPQCNFNVTTQARKCPKCDFDIYPSILEAAHTNITQSVATIDKKDATIMLFDIIAESGNIKVLCPQCKKLVPYACGKGTNKYYFICTNCNFVAAAFSIELK